MTGLSKALELARDAIVSDSRDWSVDQVDAIVWALLVGWGCEEDHKHDDDCGGQGAFREVMDRFGWDSRTVKMIRLGRAAIASLEES
ncbi:hypothetical protein [Amycolatopsis sp. cmx-4-83]|uniref:hypothetical protein n=1 Tax=Amycolatopsis sp. cmx-4-83 TaxID=2790940 RepID=UPI00397DCB7A